MKRSIATSCLFILFGCRESPPNTDSSGALSADAQDAPTTEPADADTTRVATIAPFTVRFDGFGPLEVGMTLQQANEVLGQKLETVPGTTNGACFFARWPDRAEDVGFMFSGGVFVRIDVAGGRTRTEEGVRIGDSEARIDSLYPGRVRKTRQKYIVTGNYVIVTPKDPVDSGYRIVFDTEGSAVMRYRAGRRPEVQWVEGCG